MTRNATASTMRATRHQPWSTNAANVSLQAAAIIRTPNTIAIDDTVVQSNLKITNEKRIQSDPVTRKIHQRLAPEARSLRIFSTSTVATEGAWGPPGFLFLTPSG